MSYIPPPTGINNNFLNTLTEISKDFSRIEKEKNILVLKRNKKTGEAELLRSSNKFLFFKKIASYVSDFFFQQETVYDLKVIDKKLVSLLGSELDRLSIDQKVENPLKEFQKEAVSLFGESSSLAKKITTLAQSIIKPSSSKEESLSKLEEEVKESSEVLTSFKKPEARVDRLELESEVEIEEDEKEIKEAFEKLSNYLNKNYQIKLDDNYGLTEKSTIAEIEEKINIHQYSSSYHDMELASLWTKYKIAKENPFR